MTTSSPDCAAGDFAPTHALRVWVDRTRIFVLYPAATPGTAPFVIAYARNAVGLTDALAAMSKAYDNAHPAPQISAPTVRAPTGQRKDPRRSTARTSSPAITDDERASALRVLVSAGVLPPKALS